MRSAQQGSRAPPEVIDHIVAFERSLSTAQSFSFSAGFLDAGGARGGAEALSQMTPAQGRFVDNDGNAIPDVVLSPNDADGDGVPLAADSCPLTFNPNQADRDNDGIGDVCDTCLVTANADQIDTDDDGVDDACDNCGLTASPDQTDSDDDHIGDVCDPTPPITDGRVHGAAIANESGPADQLSLDVTTRGGVVQRKGVPKYVSSRNLLALSATEIQSVSIVGDAAAIQSVGYVRARAGHRFTVTILDGQPDRFGITILKPDGQPLYEHQATATRASTWQIVRKSRAGEADSACGRT